MDKITQEDISLQTERELTSQPSSKRPRTDCTMTNNNSDKSGLDFPELLTFWEIIGSPSSRSTFQEKAGILCIADRGDTEDERPCEQPQGTQLIVTPITELTTSHIDDSNTGSSEVCLITAERCFKLLARDEQLPVTATDKPSLYPADDADGVLVESHTSKDTSADTSSQPDCKRLGKSLEDEPPGGCSPLAGNDEDGRQVQNSVSQILVFALSSGDEGFRCQSDCTHEEVLHDTEVCNTLSQSAEVEESNQNRDKHGFSENILFSNGKEEGYSPFSSTHYPDPKSFYSNPEEQPSGILAEGVKNGEDILELQICGNENVAVCDGETKGQVNEDGMSQNTIPSAAECAEGSIVSYDVVSARNIAVESVSLEADDFCEAKEERAAGKMIAKAASDHTTETPMPARISQGPAGGDNDASPFTVIDPAIWTETDREAKEKCCNSQSTAGVELFPSVKVCEMETPLPFCPDAWLSHEFNHRTRTEQCTDEKEDLWQFHIKSQACSISTNEMYNKTGSEGSCHWKSCPTKPLPAGNGAQESHDIMGHQLKEQSFRVGLDHPKTWEVEYLLTEIARMDKATEMEEREEMSEEKISTDECGNLENSLVFEEKLLQENENHMENTAAEFIRDWTEDKASKYGNTSMHIDKVLGDNHGCLFDHSYNAVISTAEVTTNRTGRKEEASIGEETEILVKSEEDHQRKSETTEHRAETFMVESKDDLLAFPLISDAVVPGPCELLHSQNADKTPSALNCHDRFSPTPSAFTFNVCVPQGFDTFKKIRLSLDDGDDDAGLSTSPLLVGLQLFKNTPQQQLPMSALNSNEHDEVPEEEEVGGLECHSKNTAKGFSRSDSRSNELPNFNSEADLCESPESFQDIFKPPCSAAPLKSNSPAADGKEFEMRKQFDMVLKELNLYFEISLSDSGEPSPEQCGDVTEALEGDASNCRKLLSSPELGRHRDASSDGSVEDCSLEMCGGDPVVTCSPGGDIGEQEVPCGRHLNQEMSICAAEKHKEPQEMEQKRLMWSPSFVCRPFLEQPNHRQPEHIRRLEPLRTCTRPIRVGLSKRAKTKHLHRPHP